MNALDLTGQRFGRLVAVSKEDGRWICRCDCGKTKRVVTGHLRDGLVRSCGCLLSERSRHAITAVQPIGREALNASSHQGTNISFIISNKPHCNSTTGVRGVSQTKSGQYRAYLTLRRHQVNLGFFDTLEEAKQACKEGEEQYYAPVIESYKLELDMSNVKNS